MTPISSVKSCLTNYFQFSGRASRSEYWWFFLATSVAVYGTMAIGFDGLSTLLWLATIIPLLAVSWRRLHDSDLAGPWLFIPAAMLLVSAYGFLFSLLFTMMPAMGNAFEGMEMSDDTTLGELREAMSDQTFATSFELEITAGNIAFIALGVAGIALDIYLKSRPSDPDTNRFGPNPSEVPS